MNQPTPKPSIFGRIFAQSWIKWGLLGFVIVLFAVAIFSVWRVNNFIDASFSGRNEQSLLTKAKPTAPPVVNLPTPANRTGNSTNDQLVNAATATPRPAGGAGALPIPTATPRLVNTPVNNNVPELIKKMRRGEAISVMLLGYGGENHDGAYLSDTILLLTYNPAKGAVTMVNIPRDFYVFIPYGGTQTGYWGKINSAFSYVMESRSPQYLSSRYNYDPSQPKTRIDAAANLTKDVVEQVTGIVVDYWATVSFDGFRRFIDAIGGVEVTVENPFTDYNYPANDNANIDASFKTVSFKVGKQLMDGERAIEFARSRQSLQDGGDFNRSRRQMKVIQAVKEKAARPEVLFKAFNILDALQGNIRTSLSLEEIKALYDYAQGDGAAKLKELYFVSQILSTENFLRSGYTNEGAYILYPYSGNGKYALIQEWLERGLNNPEIRVEALKVQVSNATASNGSLQKLTTELTDGGFDLLNPYRARYSQTSEIIDYSAGKAKNTMKRLESMLPNTTIRTEIKPQGSLADVVVVVGQDYIAGPATANNPALGNLPANNPVPSLTVVSINPNRTATPASNARYVTATPRAYNP